MMNGAKIIARFGDVNAVDFGGGVLLQLPDDSYEMEMTRGFDGEGISEEAQENGAKIEVFRFYSPKDIRKELNWVDEKDWKAIAEQWPSNWETMEDHFKSDDMAVIANLYWMVGDYFGWNNLDDYPIKLSDEELRTRWELK